MRTDKMLRSISSLVFLMAIGCSSQQKVEATASGLSVDVDRVMPAVKTLNASGVEVTLVIQNDEAEAEGVDRVEYSIDTHDIAGVLEGSVSSDASIEPSQTSELKFTQSIPLPKEEEAYKAAVAQTSFPIQIKGTVYFKNGDSVEFSKATEAVTPSLPKFFVQDAQVARYATEGLDLTIFLRLSNENTFTILIGGAEYAVTVAGKELRRENAAVGARLPAGSAQEFEVSTVLTEKSFGKEQLAQMLSEGQVSYTVTGKVDLEHISIPFEHTATIEIATGE